MNHWKQDEGKCPLGRGLLAYFPRALEEVAYTSQWGAQKYQVGYGDRTYLTVDENRYLDAALRHIMAHLSGELLDPESDLDHLSHAAWSVLAALEISMNREELYDDFE